MRKHFVLALLGLIALLFIFASHEKIAGVKSIKKGNIPSGGMVRPDLNFGKFPLYFISNKGQVDKKARFYAKASRYTLWLTKEGLVFDSVKPSQVEAEVKGEEKSPYSPHSPHSPHSTKLERDVSRLFFLNANKNPEMVSVDETKLRVNYFIGNDKSKWHCDVPTSQAVLYKNLYKNIDLKVFGIEKQIEYDWIVKPGGNPESIRFQYKNVKGTRLDEEGNLLIETDFGELIHKKPVSFQEIRMEHGACSMEGRSVIDVRFKNIGKNTYGFEVGEYDKRYDLIIDPVVLAYSTYLGGWHYEHIEAIAVDSSGNTYVTGETWETDFPTLNQYQIDQGRIDAFLTKIDTTQSGASSLVYSTYLGGSSSDAGLGIAVDRSGYTYVTGETSSSDFPTLNPFQSSFSGHSDVFVTKLDTTKSGASSLLYSTYLGGWSHENGRGIAVDNSGNAYITGDTFSTDFPTLNQYMDDPGDDCNDAFVTKIDTTQSGASCLTYSTYLGGDWDDHGWEIAVDNIGYAYAIGYTFSTDFPTRNQYQTDQGNGDCDAFVTKIDTTQNGGSSLIYSTYLGGSGYDYGYGIAVDNNAYAYVTGFTASMDFPILNQFQSGSGIDSFVTKLDTTQSGTSCLIYSTYLGGVGYTEGYGIALDNIGYVYVTGYTDCRDFPTLNQYQTYQGRDDAFVTKLDTTQKGASCLIFSTYLGGEEDDRAYGVAVDSKGNIYVAGFTDSTDFPILNQYQEDQGNYDAFITKLNAFPITLPNVLTTVVSSITTTSAESGGEVTWDGGVEVTARGVCWSTSENPTTDDSHTTDGTGTGTFDSSLTDLSPDTLYYVRAYATNAMGTAYGHEEIFETDEPFITVTSPSGGETWEVNSLKTIAWTSQYVEGNVKIEYSTNGGNQWTEIIASTPNDGSHPWTVPAASSDQCLVKISETGTSTWGISSGFFTILTPSLTVTSPNGGEIWTANSQQTITWTSNGTVGDVKIEHSTDNGDNWTEIIASTPNDGSHPWTVPGTVSSQCLVRVSETDGMPTDDSDSVFSIVSTTSVTVLSPNGGETLYVGSVQNIMWTSAGTVGDVKVEYSTDNGDQWTEIIASTENDGSYSWTVPGTVSNQCLARVGETGGGPSDSSDNVFSIQQLPTITVTSPNGGENLEAGSVHNITWTSQGDIGNVMIEYSVNAGKTWRIIARSTGNDGSFNWTVPGNPSDNCLVRISAGDPDGGLSDTSDDLFSIVPLSNASITVTSLNGGEQLVPGSSHEIKWTAEGTDQVPYVTIEYSTDRGATWATVASSLNNAADGSFDWTVPNTPSNNCLLRVRGISEDGDPSDSSDGVFSILPLSSPAFTVTSPNGGESWLVNSQQEITWETNGTVNNVKIDYSPNGGESWTEIVGSTPNNGSFDWDVPNTPSDNCLVRVGDANNGGQSSDTGDTVFSIGSIPSITVTSPNGGEQWEAGSSQTITWTSTGPVGDITIEYSTDGGDNWTQITGNEPDNGSYNWTVLDTPSDDCLVRITGNDTDPVVPLFDVSDNPFSIAAAQELSLAVSSPNGGEDLFVGLSHEITWTSFGSVGNVTIDYSSNGGSTWIEIIPSTENDGSYDWTVPDAVSGNCLVRVYETDGDPLDISDAVFSILALPEGTITITSPNGGETWLVDSTREITWTSTGTINDVSIHYSTNSGTTWTAIAASTANDGSHDWTVPGTPSENCLVRVRAKVGDWDGGPSDTSDEVFSIFTSSPVALRVVSPDGGETWKVGSTQQITWNSNGNLENITIVYSTNNGATWATIVESKIDNGTYNWVVPDTPSGDCLVRISAGLAGSDEEVSDVSEAVFSIVSPTVPTITVDTPNGGELLYTGYLYDITWTSIGTVDNITIEYSSNGGDTWTEIAGGVPNSGSFEWIVPDEPSDSCLVRIGETGGTPLDVSDTVFSIGSSPSVTIEVLTPNGGESLDAGTEYDITWASNGIDNVIIEYSTNNGVSWGFIATASAADGTYLWIVPGTGSDNCLVRVSGNDGGENPSDASDAVFSIESSQASVEVLTPNGGESLGVGAEYDITWTYIGLQNVLIEYSDDNGNTWYVIDSFPAVGRRYTWTVPNTPSVISLVRVSGNDGGEDPSDVSDTVFSIAADRP